MMMQGMGGPTVAPQMTTWILPGHERSRLSSVVPLWTGLPDLASSSTLFLPRLNSCIHRLSVACEKALSVEVLIIFYNKFQMVTFL